MVKEPAKKKAANAFMNAIVAQVLQNVINKEKDLVQRAKNAKDLDKLTVKAVLGGRSPFQKEFEKYCKTEYAMESLNFLKDSAGRPNENKTKQIYEQYIAKNCKNQINISSKIRKPLIDQQGDWKNMDFRQARHSIIGMLTATLLGFVKLKRDELNAE